MFSSPERGSTKASSIFVPKWKKKITSQYSKSVCSYPNCLTSPNSRLISPSFAAVSEIQAFLNVIPSSGARPLYYVQTTTSMFNYTAAFKSPSSCACYGIQPKACKSFYQHCPDSDYINSVLCGAEIITKDDVICSYCYKSHLALCTASCDPQNGSKSQLENIISIWQYNLAV